MSPQVRRPGRAREVDDQALEMESAVVNVPMKDGIEFSAEVFVGFLLRPEVLACFPWQVDIGTV